MTRRKDQMTLTIRTSKELHKWLKAQARKNGRSLNQEAEARLIRSRETEETKPILDELRAIVSEARKK
jgi:predicted HicB family RNase H-like nuclease